MWDICRYHVVLFHCIVPRLAMWHSRIFILGIFKILNRCIISPSQKCPPWCLAQSKYFYVKSVCMWDLCRYHVLFYRCIVSRLAMSHSPVFSLGILEILNKSMVSHSRKCSRGCLTRGTHFLREKCVDVRSLLLSYSFLSLHCLTFSDVPQFRFKSRNFKIVNRSIVSSSRKCSRGCLTRGTHFSWKVHRCEMVVDIMQFSIIASSSV